MAFRRDGREEGGDWKGRNPDVTGEGHKGEWGQI